MPGFVLFACACVQHVPMHAFSRSMHLLIILSQVLMDALPPSWKGTLVMMDHLYAYVSVTSSSTSYKNTEFLGGLYASRVGQVNPRHPYM